MGKLEAVTIAVLLFLILFIGITSSILINKAENQRDAFSTILHADLEIAIANSMSQRANDLYAEASFAYEDGDYNAVESNCRLARGHFSDSSNKFLSIQAMLEDEGDDPMILLYAEGMEVLSETQLNLFEACEHFEVASRYYADENYAMGDAEIEMMNEKIKDHDDNIRKYNSILADYKVELGRRL